jgi:hypothetical protein
LKALTIAFFE